VTVGFFKDVNQLSKQGRAIRDSMPPPSEQMAAAQAQMAAITAQMNQQASAAGAVAADGIAGTAQVLSAAQTGALVNFNPAVRVELLVTVPESPPYPVSLETVVPQLHLARVQPGATVPVRVARADRTQVMLDWAAPL
jgi:hypothetical protein